MKIRRVSLAKKKEQNTVCLPIRVKSKWRRFKKGVK